MLLNLHKESWIVYFRGFVIIPILLQLCGNVMSLAVFETRILSFTNVKNMIASRKCCSTGTTSPSPSGCSFQCQTYIEVCLDDVHLSEPNCRFGEAVSLNYERSNLAFNNSSPSRNLEISFHSSWPGEFGIRINVFDNASSHISPKGSIIQTLSIVDNKKPSMKWYSLNSTGPVSSLHFQYRIKCGTYYYGANCTSYCKERHDQHGHYRCDSEGRRICLDGWIDPTSFCRQAVCVPSCKNGRCTDPNKCSCHHGWRGQDCSVCITRTGCQNGACSIPGDCICDTGWGGVNCDRELDYCGMRTPCLNLGTCINFSSPQNFMCFCTTGYTGRFCETKITACTSNPCKNGATCHVTHGGFICNCTAEYTGSQCKTFIDLCASKICKNNGTCSVVKGLATCECVHPYTGMQCEDTMPSPSYTLLVVGSTLLKNYTTFSSSYNGEFSRVTPPFSRPSSLRMTSIRFTISSTNTLAMKKSDSATRTKIAITSSSASWTTGLQSHLHTTFSPTTNNAVSVTHSRFSNNSITATISSVRVFSSEIKAYEIIETQVQRQASINISASSHLLMSYSSRSAGNKSTSSVDIGQKYKEEEPTDISLAVAISASLSIVLMIILALILIWRQKSKERGDRARISSIVPFSVNSPQDLIDPGNFNYANFAETAINNRAEHCDGGNAETSSENSSNHSVFVCNRETGTACQPKMSSARTKGRQETVSAQVRNDSNTNVDGIVNYGYLSEGTSGYSSDCSSARSSANFHSKVFKSALNTNEIYVLSIRHHSRGEDIEDLPNCIVYQEETL